MENIYRTLSLTATGVTAIAWNRYRDEVPWIDSVLAKSAQLPVEAGAGAGRPPGADAINSNGIVVDQQDTPQSLRLKHVQVLFCPGPSTPENSLQSLGKMSYRPEFLHRPHYQSMFPWTRQPFPGDPCTNVTWTDKDNKLMESELHGGCIPGQLTNMGKEKMFELGWALKHTYMERLKLGSPHSKRILVACHNTKRAVESTESLLTGLYGGLENLQDIVHSGETLAPIYVECDHTNVLSPNCSDHPVLQQAVGILLTHNYTSPDTALLPVVGRKDTASTEVDFDHNLTSRLQDVVRAQNKIECYLRDIQVGAAATSVEVLDFNEDRQPVTFDPRREEMMKQRNKAIEKVTSFWPNVISHHPQLASAFTPKELKVIQYITKFEVEEFHQRFQDGFRIKFHFSPNPYFHNSVLCKEIHHTFGQSSQPRSWSTSIQWKTGQEALTVRETPTAAQPNFFTWYLKPTGSHNNRIGETLKNEVWKNPMTFYNTATFSGESPIKLKPIDFVALRKEVNGRQALGLDCPECVQTLSADHPAMHDEFTQLPLEKRQEVVQMCVGRLLIQLIERANPLRSTNVRLYLYCCSDVTLTGLLEAMGLWDMTLTLQGSDLRLEVYEDINKVSKKFIRVLFNGKAVNIRNNQADTFVPLKSFSQALKMEAHKPQT